MFAKIIIFALVVVAIYVLFFKKRIHKNVNSQDTENFVECEKCGTFVALKDAVLRDGKYICKECLE